MPSKQRRPHPGNGVARAYFQAHITDQTDECFPWPFNKSGDPGYGRLHVPGVGQRRVHVLACEYAHGPRPPKLQAIHGPCTLWPECWNPRHLRWGTRRQNQLDRHRDGKPWARGEALKSKLTDAQVVELLDAWVSGVPQPDLAARYGVNLNTINGVINGRTWAHIPRPAGVVEPKDVAPPGQRAKLTQDTALDVLNCIAEGTATQRELADRHGVRKNTINAAVNGRSWAHLPRPPRSDGQPWRTGEPIQVRAKLTAAQASKIRVRYAAGERPRALAAEYGVHRETIRAVVNGATWCSA